MNQYCGGLGWNNSSLSLRRRQIDSRRGNNSDLGQGIRNKFFFKTAELWPLILGRYTDLRPDIYDTHALVRYVFLLVGDLCFVLSILCVKHLRFIMLKSLGILNEEASLYNVYVYY